MADNADPFDLDLVSARLIAEVPKPVLQVVKGAAEYAALTSLREARAGTVYVLPAGERSDGNEEQRGGRQRALVNFGVVLAVKNSRDGRGEAALQELGPFLGHVRKALMGWLPDVPGARPVRWVSGQVLDYDASILLWSEVYRTQMFIGPALNA